jgi:hypothetical protein
MQQEQKPMRIKALLTPLAALSVAGAVASWSAPARADIAAAYLEGHGGLGNNGSDASSRASTAANSTSGVAPALGFQLGARVLIFEGYFDRTGFGSGASVSRGILGLRAGFGGDTRLVLRAGGGVITEEGGALTGMSLGVPQREGVVGRAGVAVETRLSPGPAKLLGGAALDGEVFSLASASPAPNGFTGRTQGSDAFLSLYLKFELGI